MPNRDQTDPSAAETYSLSNGIFVMNQALSQYKALSSNSKEKVSTTFISIVAALRTNQLDVRSRKTLTQLIIDDLKAVLLNNNTPSRLSKDDAPQALSTLKSLGGTPDVAAILATSSNLRTLLNLSTKIDDSKRNDPLRCIANTMLLNESARVAFIRPDVDGGRLCIDLLQKSTIEHVFLASRILFFCTAASSAAPFIQWLVEQDQPNVPGSGTAIDIIGTKLDDLTESMNDGKNTATKDAITDLLKLIFNLFVHYPKIVDCELQSPEITRSDADDKVMGDYWSTRLDNLLPPLLRTFHLNCTSSNPLEAPLPHIIHSLIIVPVLPRNRNLWFGEQPETSPSSAGQPSTSCSSSSCSSTLVFQDSALRAYDLLDMTLAYFMPGDINSDDPSIRSRCPEGETLDDLVSPLVILITRFCLGDDDAKVRIRNWFIPPDIDRSDPLESRSDLLGRCLRLLQSVYHSRLNRTCGEMFFAMCNSDPVTLSGYVGYGNVAGFLFQRGVVCPPAKSTVSCACAPTTTSTGLPINPITGTIEKNQEPVSMTEEEKEQEAEKLFVLFERLEKSGALAPNQNPLRRAVQQGKLG